jgi:outer membrane protein assembly factor BamB
MRAWADDWPQFLGPRRNGISQEHGLNLAWTKEGPRLLWEMPVGAGFAGPVVAGDRLVLFHRVGNEEVVACLEPATGKEKWYFRYATAYVDEFGFDEGPRSTPTIAGNQVFTLGAQGTLHCLDLTTGAKLWGRDLNGEYHVRKGYFGVATSPLLVDDHLLVNVGGRDAGIVAFDKNTGHEVWRATNHEASYSSPVVATIDGATRAVFLTREGIVVIDPRDGKITFSKHWRARISASVNAASPVVAGSDLFFSASYGTGAILLHVDHGAFDEVWKNDESLSNHYTTSIANEGFLYGFDGRQEEGARLRCVELKTGKVLWSVDGFGCGSMILADKHLLILHEKGSLISAAASPVAFKEFARAELLTGPCRSPLALANGRLYARDPKRLCCWDLRK